MKLNRTHFLIAASTIALILVLAIQVNWILQTAKVKEELFNEKANMVLSRTAETLSSDKEACMKMGNCCKLESNTECKLELEKTELEKIDSLLNKFMNYYNFHLDYKFEVIQPTFFGKTSFGSNRNNNVFNKKLEEVANKYGLELRLIFPERKQFIIAEMGAMFIASVVLILVVLLMFWKTISFLLKEKEISEHFNDFLNNMTHEFKTPLTNIALAGKMLGKDVNIKDENRVRHYAEIILQENERLKFQVDQVLGMTALERGEIPIHKINLDFHQLIRDALRCMEVQMENRQGEIRLNLNATQFEIKGDKSHLSNALHNLIDNAIKYSMDKPMISIETLNVNNQIVFKIKDQGIGIEKEYQKNIFDKFYRVPTGDLHDVKGFGIGLAYVIKIVEMHGGSIELSSEKNKGTMFAITIPTLNG